MTMMNESTLSPPRKNDNCGRTSGPTTRVTTPHRRKPKPAASVGTSSIPILLDRMMMSAETTNKRRDTNSNNNNTLSRNSSLLPMSLSLPILSAEPIASSKTTSSRKRKLTITRIIPILIVVTTAFLRMIWLFYQFNQNTGVVGDPYSYSSFYYYHPHYNSMEWSRILDTALQKQPYVNPKRQPPYHFPSIQDEDVLDPWTLVNITIDRSRSTQMQQQRIQQSRPPPLLSLHHPSHVTPLRKRIDEAIQTKPLSDDFEKDWKTLCHKANLNESSRIWITNILTVPTATAFALLVARQCQTQMIIGIDPMLPNLPSIIRIPAILDRYRILVRSIHPTQFQFLGPSEKELGWEEENMTQLQPTHILHFDNNNNHHHYNNKHDDDDNYDSSWDPYMSKKSQRQYRLHQSLSTTQQILQYAKQQHQQQSHTSNNNNDNTNTNRTTTTAIIPKLLQITTGTSQQHALQKLLFECYHVHSSRKINFSTLQLSKMIFGPLISTTTTTTTYMNDTFFLFKNGKAMFVDDAMKAILTALHQQRNDDDHSIHHYTIPTKEKNGESTIPDNHVPMEEQTLQIIQAHHADITLPYGERSQANRDSNSTKRLRQAGDIYRSTYGIFQTQFPCAASCTGKASTCTPSIWDNIAPISQQATRNCSFVVYQVDYDDQLESLVQPLPHIGPFEVPSSVLCRVAFVSSQAPVVKTTILQAPGLKNNITGGDDRDHHNQDTLLSQTTSMLQTHNGKLQFNNWTLIWLHDTKKMTDAEYSLPWMEPSQLFASSVYKAMFTTLPEFAQPPDAALMRILSRINRPASPAHDMKEVRSGLPKISRWIPHPAEPARAAALFAASPWDVPKNIREYVTIAKNMGLEIPSLQSEFYQQAADYISADDRFRPESEFPFIKDSFPLVWISMDLLVHDLHMDAARLLRCQWYDETLYWGEKEHENRDVEELGLAWILAKRQVEGQLGPPLDDGWYPLWQQRQQQQQKGSETTTTTTTNDKQPQPLLNLRGIEIFVHIMSRLTSSS